MTFLSTPETLSAALLSQITSESASSFSFGDRPQIFPLLHSRSQQGWASPPPEINDRRLQPSRESSLINNPHKLGQKLFWFNFSGVNRTVGLS